ncbi:MAG: ATP-binding cassette domain-containing protein, partial [Elusimicrobiaceae bacterium]|nr:ATP-binding cassette domain-containing protein [Elusimicrobiaceae bacterium]
MPSNTVLELREIKKTYVKNSFLRKQKTEVLKGANLTLKEGRTLALIGPSGCGKTTLLKIILGLEKQDSGTIKIFGEDISKTGKK